MDAPSAILVVEDNDDVVRSIRRVVGGDHPLVVAGTAKRALEVLETGSDFVAAIMDIKLPDGDGLDVLERFCARKPGLRALVLTAFSDPDFINRAQQLGAEYACKPRYVAGLRAFLSRLCPGGNLVERERHAARAYGRTHGLTDREVEVLLLSLEDLSRAEIAQRLGVTPETVKTHVGAILEKTTLATLGEVVRTLRAQARRT